MNNSYPGEVVITEFSDPDDKVVLLVVLVFSVLVIVVSVDVIVVVFETGTEDEVNDSFI